MSDQPRPDVRLVPMTREVQVWVCPWCGACERYDSPLDGQPAYVPNCEWCADDPEGGEVAMVRHVAAPLAAWDAAPADPAEDIALCVSQWNGYGPDVQSNHRKCAADVLRVLGAPERAATQQEDADA